MKELTPEEIEAWDGLCESYDEMAEEIERSAPKCHFKTMSLEGDEGTWDGAWWECEVCGHTKPYRL
ncbi:hypothetical protein ACW5XW_08325 [Aeromonas piscicola]|uniref:hypothetical protein n=1 Tax=Aeromonas piscicola TaxID=600645 RepID=UPI0012E0842F|nr:hypothetical protein [Aeromonas piscicola]